jgi:hypothetical protein
MKKIIFTTIAVLALAGIAQADLVSYTVQGWGPTQFPSTTTPPYTAPWGTEGYPGDTVEFETFTSTLDLTPGTYMQKINTLLWKIDYTYGGTETNPDDWSELLFNFNAVRNISFGGGTNSPLSQSGSLGVTWDNDYIGLAQGSTISVIVQGYRVDITPLALAAVGGSNFSGSNPWIQPSLDVMAQFVVTAVPIPATVLLGLIGLGIGGWKLRKSL